MLNIHFKQLVYLLGWFLSLGCMLLTHAALLESCWNMTESKVMLFGFLELDSSL